jgi:hypothetical protein
MSQRLRIGTNCICTFWAIALSLFLTDFAGCQTYPKAEVFGGYSYTNVDMGNGLREGSNGLEISASANFNRWFAAEADFTGSYQHLADGGGTAGTYSYLAGPRFNLMHKHNPLNPLFVHFLLGFQHLSGTDFGSPVSNTAIASALGVGTEWKISNGWAVRSSVDYAFTRYFATQNNVRAAVGLAYLFGGARSGNIATKSR